MQDAQLNVLLAHRAVYIYTKTTNNDRLLATNINRRLVISIKNVWHIFFVQGTGTVHSTRKQNFIMIYYDAQRFFPVVFITTTIVFV